MKSINLIRLIITISILNFLVLGGCVKSHHRKKIHVYMRAAFNTNDDDWNFIYEFPSTENGKTTYYYTLSNKPVTNFSNQTWQASSSKPKEIEEPDVDEVADTEMVVEQLPQSLQEEVETDTENSSTVSEDTNNSDSDSDSDGGGDD